VTCYVNKIGASKCKCYGKPWHRLHLFFGGFKESEKIIKEAVETARIISEEMGYVKREGQTE